MGKSAVSLLLQITAIANAVSGAAAAGSPKRGLIYIPPQSGDTGQDAPLLTASSSLSWYYNYNPTPSTTISNSTSALKLEFVPQLWGASDDNGGSRFVDTVRPLLDDPANNITSMLFMNEPDMGKDGGSGVDPGDAADLWQKQFASLKEDHPSLQLGSPAVSNGPSGFPWLDEWFSECDGKCEPDFMAVHYYGPFDGLVSYLELVQNTYNNITSRGGIWLTEFAFPAQDLNATLDFFQRSVQYLDTQDAIRRYSYFGSFESDNANSFVGENVAMLNKNGKLTSIGAQYVGAGTTGADPNAGARWGVSWGGVAMAAVVAMLSWVL